MAPDTIPEIVAALAKLDVDLPLRPHSDDLYTATASGEGGKARGAEGCAIFLVERGDDGRILHAWAGIAGRDGIRPMIWYRLEDGRPVEVAD